MNKAKNWFSIREYGSKKGISLLLACYKFGGRWLFAGILFPVIFFYFLLRRDARHASYLYLEKMHHINNAFPKPRVQHCFLHFWHFGLCLLDKFNVWMGYIQRSDVTIHGGEYIADMIAQGKGGVIFTSHLGNFEICHALSEGRDGMRLTVLHHSQHTAKFNEVLRRYSRDSQVELMQVGDLSIGSAIRLSEKISRGEFIAVAADRTPINNPTAVQLIDFLGVPAAFPTGPFSMALALQCPIFALHCIKLNGRYHIHFEPLSKGEISSRKQRETILATLMKKHVQRLEHFCKQAPWQWFNFYPFWPSDDTDNQP
ncbi:LpxL/LpxP family acyltransferase [Zhongshania aliphaticivorans]|uniref:LpxL/LpxP family acyltransferase n=1 Tax=Zhongshania aliphaticivorans TaxID=1470434 RepID=UPI0012E47D2B|nr:acyltransferase [Zhongshania aliphaticivorans]CAA0100623.1 Lipid A biosynthesis lauroyltransferase [Zhongshania aliphaticivorans]